MQWEIHICNLPVFEGKSPGIYGKTRENYGYGSAITDCDYEKAPLSHRESQALAAALGVPAALGEMSSWLDREYVHQAYGPTTISPD